MCIFEHTFESLTVSRLLTVMVHVNAGLPDHNIIRRRFLDWGGGLLLSSCLAENWHWHYLAGLVQARACSANIVVIHSFIHSVSDLFLTLFLRHCQAQTIWDGVSNHKIDYVASVKGILNLKGYRNPIIGSKITAILLNVWILPSGGAASGRVCAQPAKQASLNK